MDEQAYWLMWQFILASVGLNLFREAINGMGREGGGAQ